ncbi:MAG TPA: hypothetical protein DIT03_06415 [Candidatus Accumulibacter sp.]|nr:MAG: hypothetical protein AW07_01174 [Candidatus Accumulibacter sp. SK-11]HCN67897.1 hypothetical protein [Accumulibacter sp.]
MRTGHPQHARPLAILVAAALAAGISACNVGIRRRPAGSSACIRPGACCCRTDSGRLTVDVAGSAGGDDHEKPPSGGMGGVHSVSNGFPAVPGTLS